MITGPSPSAHCINVNDGQKHKRNTHWRGGGGVHRHREPRQHPARALGDAAGAQGRLAEGPRQREGPGGQGRHPGAGRRMKSNAGQQRAEQHALGSGAARAPAGSSLRTQTTG